MVVEINSGLHQETESKDEGNEEKFDRNSSGLEHHLAKIKKN